MGCDGKAPDTDIAQHKFCSALRRLERKLISKVYTHANIARVSCASYFTALEYILKLSVVFEKTVKNTRTSRVDLIKVIGLSHVINVLIPEQTNNCTATHFGTIERRRFGTDGGIHAGDKYRHIWLIWMHDLYFMSVIFSRRFSAKVWDFEKCVCAIIACLGAIHLWILMKMWLEAERATERLKSRRRTHLNNLKISSKRFFAKQSNDCHCVSLLVIAYTTLSANYKRMNDRIIATYVLEKWYVLRMLSPCFILRTNDAGAKKKWNRCVNANGIKQKWVASVWFSIIARWRTHAGGSMPLHSMRSTWGARKR